MSISETCGKIEFNTFLVCKKGHHLVDILPGRHHDFDVLCRHGKGDAAMLR